MTEDDNDKIIFLDTRPSRADAIKNRELLLKTAGRLFEEHGVDAVSMTQIAQEARVGKGTLYRHFTSKNDLCHALLDQDMRDLQEDTLKRLKHAEDTPEETLRWFLGAIVAFVDRNNELLRTESEMASGLIFPAHLWWRQTIRGLLGRLNITGDLDYLTDVFYVMLDAQAIHFQRDIMGYGRQRVINGLNETLSHFLK